jgi:fatty-acyl-CoA synthase
MRPVATLEDILAIEREQPDSCAGIASTYDMLKKGAAIAPHAPALTFFLRTDDHKQPFVWSYSENLKRITQTANMLRRIGVGRNDVVAYLLPNLPETLWIIWGAETAGVVMAINPLLEPPVIIELLKAGNVSWLVTLAPTPGADLWEKAQIVVSESESLRGVITASPLQYVRGIKGAIARAISQYKTPKKLISRARPIPVLDFQVEIAREAGGELNFAPPQRHDVASYFCTGGTTGAPKIAVRSHNCEIENAFAVRTVVGNHAGPGNNMFCGLPLFHVNAQLGTALAAWSCGSHLVLGSSQGYRAPGLMARFWEIVAHHQLHTFSGVPTVYAALMQVPINGADISSLNLAMCGAAPMPVELFRNFEKRTGVRILEGYGLTEGGCVSSINPPNGISKIGSIGLRLPWQDMRVLVLDKYGRYERDATVDEAGVIAISGPNVFEGYLNADHNDGLWIARPSESGQVQRWLNTGDLGRCDADGYFWLTGRKKELIIRSGHNIDPKSIEETLHQHPAVALAAAVGRPDPHTGEMPVAYVQLKPNSSTTEDELLGFAAAHISERAAVPKHIRIIATLPTTAVGKIFKPALTLMEIESVVREEAGACGVVLNQLTIIQQPQKGMLAQISVQGGNGNLRQRLGAYTFAVEELSQEHE